MTSTPKTPAATIARSVAAAMWPTVQRQRKLTRGAFEFSCAGHGGIVALVDQLDITPEILEAARQTGRIALVGRFNLGRRTQTTCTAAGYNRASVETNAERYPAHSELREVLIAEDDCEWATLALVSPAIRAAFNVTEADAREVADRYFPDFVAAIDALAVAA